MHVDDAALAVMKVLVAPLGLVRNQVFNVGSDDQNYTILQVAQVIHRWVPTARLLTYASQSDRRNYRVSFSKIRNTLEFVPHWTLEQGIRQVAEAIQSGKVEDYRDARYSNVRFLSEQGIVHFEHRDSNWAHHWINEWPGESVRPVRELQSASAR